MLHSRSSSYPMWVESNDANVNLSEISFFVDDQGRRRMSIPEYMFDEYLTDGFYCGIYHDQGNVVIDAFYYEELMRSRKEKHYACYWYDKISQCIPTAPSILLEFSDNYDLQSHASSNFERYPFFRMCHASPKDVINPPILTEEGDSAWYNIGMFLLQSERTRDQAICTRIEEAYGDTSVDSLTSEFSRLKSSYNDCTCNGHHHLFMREYRQYEWEVRCFWSRGKLTAVSLPQEICIYDETYEDDIKSILQFFDQYGEYIPYTSTTIDIGLAVFEDGTKRVELIEFNTFGPDMIATAGNFSRYEDAHQLVYGWQVEIR